MATLPTRRAAPIGGYTCHVPVLPGAIGWIVGAESPPSDPPGMERVAVGATAPTGPSVARRVPVRGARELAVGLEVRERAARDRTSQHISAGQRRLTRIEGERSVKPSAQPTLVRTQHLPPVSAAQSR